MISLPTQIKKPLLTALVALATCGAGAGVAAPAYASHSQATFFEASSVLLNPGKRQAAIAQMQALGVTAIRVELYWSKVVPGANAAKRPAFNAEDPNSYSWGAYDWLLAEAAARKWQVLLTVTSPAPRWATSDHKSPYVTRPDPRDFKEFMTAVARHYGSEVTLYSIWNEANHPAFLRPQWNTNGTPASPKIYRGLYQAAYAGLHAAGLVHPQVLFGETAPTGYESVSVRSEGKRALLHDVAPLLFLRGALCLNSHYVKSSSCEALEMAGYAHHAYTTAAGPLYVPPERDNVTIGVLSRLTRALDLAARAHAVPAQVPLYLTEFGVQSKPNRFLGVPVAQQAEYDAIAEHIAWNNPRVAAFSQYLLRDDPLGGRPGSSVNGGTIGFQTGLEYLNGARKPLYFGWPVPLTVSKIGGAYTLWGFVRPAGTTTTVTVLIRPRGSRSYRKLATVKTDNLGYWGLRSSASGVAWRVRWISPAGAKYEGPPIGAH
jgi:hypothetical protein